jgi:chromosome segregation ATPase
MSFNENAERVDVVISNPRNRFLSIDEPGLFKLLELQLSDHQSALSKISSALSQSRSTQQQNATKIAQLDQSIKDYEQQSRVTSVKITELTAQKQNLQTDLRATKQSKQALIEGMNEPKASWRKSGASS